MYVRLGLCWAGGGGVRFAIYRIFTAFLPQFTAIHCNCFGAGGGAIPPPGLCSLVPWQQIWLAILSFVAEGLKWSFLICDFPVAWGAH